LNDSVDFLLTKAPGLDDTCKGRGSATGSEFEVFWKLGDWVSGGGWGTVEGRSKYFIIVW